MRLKETLSRVADAVMFMTFGAWMTVGFLGGDELPGHPYLDGALMIAFLMAAFVSNLLQPKRKAIETAEVSPAVSGVAVVAIVGLAVVLAFVWYDALAMAAGAFIFTAFVASRAWSFATAHRDEIGEARFTSDTTAS